MRFSLRRRFVFFRTLPSQRHPRKALLWIGVIALLVAANVYLFDARIRPALCALAAARVKQIGTRLINEAVKTELAGEVQYQQLVQIQLNREGKVALLQPNNREISRIYSEATLAINRRLQAICRETIAIPFGQTTGLHFLANMGPLIPVRVLPVGTVETHLNDHFDSAGINQVRHRIYLDVTATMKVAVPMDTREIKATTEIPLAETIIVGDVPSVYANGAGILLPAK